VLGKEAYDAIKGIIETSFTNEGKELNTKIVRTENILKANPDSLVNEAFEMLHQETSLKIAKLEDEYFHTMVWLDEGPFRK
jgi:hypothetical protein